MNRGLATRAVTLAGGIAVALALLGATAWACVPQASISLSPNTGPVGSEITMTGSSFSADATVVKVWWGGVAKQLMATTNVASDRTIRLTFKVPDVAGGTHIVSATQHGADGVSIGNPSNATFKVNAPGSATAQAPNLQGDAQNADGAAALEPGSVQTAAEATAPAPTTATQTAPARRPVASSTQAAQAVTATTAQPAPAAAAEAVAAPAPAAQPPAAAAPTSPTVTQPAPAFAAPSAAADEAEEPSRSSTPVWALVGLAVLALAFLSTGTAIFLTERKRVRAQA